MPLIGLEPVAALLDKTPLLRGTPVSMLLYLHTYLLLEGPNTEVGTGWAGEQLAAELRVAQSNGCVLPVCFPPCCCCHAQQQSGVWYLDFLPLAPTSPGTALPLLTGGRVPGELSRPL